MSGTWLLKDLCLWRGSPAGTMGVWSSSVQSCCYSCCPWSRKAHPHLLWEKRMEKVMRYFFYNKQPVYVYIVLNHDNSQKLVVEVLCPNEHGYKLTHFAIIFMIGLPRLPNTISKYKTKTLKFFNKTDFLSPR